MPPPPGTPGGAGPKGSPCGMTATQGPMSLANRVNRVNRANRVNRINRVNRVNRVNMVDRVRVECRVGLESG